MNKLFIRNRHIFLIDILMGFLAYLGALVLVAPLSELEIYYNTGVPIILITVAMYPLVFIFSKIYRIDWVYAGAKEYITLLASCAVAMVLSLLSDFIPGVGIISTKLCVAANFFIIAVLCAIRFLIRLVHRHRPGKDKTRNKRVLIIGAGYLAVTLLRSIENNHNLNYNVVGLIDDEPQKKGSRVYGTSVIGGRDDIVRLCKERDVEEIIFAIYKIPHHEKQKILDICSKAGCKVKVIHGVDVNLDGEITQSIIKEVDIDDLLERAPVVLDNRLIESDIFGRVVLVTGGGGSIGSELCRQILSYNPQKLIILDIYENTTYELQLELQKQYPHHNIDVIIASVRDKKRLNYIFNRYKPNLVFHAAAHKHVPLMEESPCEAVKNNVFGTYNVVKCAEEYEVDTFVLISTDKAVNPTNIMGATKRMCEMIVQAYAGKSHTKFAAVRFGNVLGSNGSVIPLFKKQIAEGGPVTVTHRDITRFFMTIPEAAQLVLQAMSYAEGGEIFVLDMGEPVKIYDMARKLIFLSGYKPDEDIKIAVTGLRPGEKLYEELLMAEEGLSSTAHSKIFVGKPIDITAEEVEEKLSLLSEALESEGSNIKSVMAQIVPTYAYKTKQKSVI